MRRPAVLTLIFMGACGYGASYKVARGGATASPGVASGTTTSVTLSDTGGALTNLFFSTAGVVAAASSSRTRTLERTQRIEEQGNGDRIVRTHTVTSTTVDQEQLENAQELMDLETEAGRDRDPRNSSFGSTLEIASRNLGFDGDTTGFLFDIGGRLPVAELTDRLVVQVAVGFGFGVMKFYGRERRFVTEDAVLPSEPAPMVMTEIGDSRYNYVGVPSGVLLAYGPWLRLFLLGDFNVITGVNTALGGTLATPGSPSPWHAGGELQVGPVRVEASVDFSGFSSPQRGYTLEAGFAF